MSTGRDIQGRIYRAGLFGTRPTVPTSYDELEAAAQRRMSAEAWSYVYGGAGLQSTVRANREALDRVRLVPRYLVDVEQRDLSVDLLGRRLSSPLLLAPIGVLEMAHPDAEYAVARAARELDVPMVISTQGSVAMEETARTLGATPRLFQLYWSRDEDVVRSFVQRAESIGADAIVVTLDTHLLGWRTRDLDLGYLPFARAEGIAQYTSDPAFRALVEGRVATPAQGRGASADAGEVRPSLRQIPAALRALSSMRRHWPEAAPGSGSGSGSGRRRVGLGDPRPRAAVETFLDVFSRSDLTWADLARLREMTRLPIMVKGVQHRGDARLALEHGVDGLVVSNHGGRQVDGAIGSLEALPGVVEEVDGRVPVLFDSGIRGGADVVKALALGARAVLVGRPWVYGLALAGEAGVRAVLEHLLAELDLTLGLVGVRTAADLGPHVLAGAA
ncbi:alpha-hydroxy-acid oxidizing protein [Nocardioides sp. Iso805N]|uniref:alpha-hydroxy-acid oxidizing protein n=1 Tax=Nocardioides sp. Iso805N TaxID=1283287 RepID=UPI0003690394|nr:alpha-hydroxy-acid oxidizing protein [Nocardioides sp. Iso805N]